MSQSTPNLLADSHALVVLMIEHEQSEGLSARKLVMETAKHNVLTAYAPEEGIVLLRRFPRVSLVLVHAAVLEGGSVLSEVRSIAPETPIVVASPDPSLHFEGADFVISSHDPQGLLDLLAEKFHIPKAPAER